MQIPSSTELQINQQNPNDLLLTITDYETSEELCTYLASGALAAQIALQQDGQLIGRNITVISASHNVRLQLDGALITIPYQIFQDRILPVVLTEAELQFFNELLKCTRGTAKVHLRFKAQEFFETYATTEEGKEALDRVFLAISKLNPDLSEKIEDAWRDVGNHEWHWE